MPDELIWHALQKVFTLKCGALIEKLDCDF